jgi:hypothetical protein
MKLIVGFTGTRDGMTPEQKTTFVEVLSPYHGRFDFHHGDCLGADDEAHGLVVGDLLLNDPGSGDPRIAIHPPSDPKLRARRRPCLEFGDWLCPEKPYLERNRDIVDACDMLIACPKERRPDIPVDPTNLYSGGTWYTVRYAQTVDKPITIIWPDGTTS